MEINLTEKHVKIHNSKSLTIIIIFYIMILVNSKFFNKYQSFCIATNKTLLEHKLKHIKHKCNKSLQNKLDKLKM